MTAEEYVENQCEAFHKTCEDMAYKVDFGYELSSLEKLDDVKWALWPDDVPVELGSAIAIMWAAFFTKILANTYISKWTVDPQSKTPSLILKCGGKGLQVKSVLIATHAFNEGKSYVDFWSELKKTLDEAGAELKPQ
ncbi:MAG: hypothetical protein NE334_02765 [Lentisphaeraceae bacterium]|nr:hypothetical protein [Lentisphaeraceae bacterium]